MRAANLPSTQGTHNTGSTFYLKAIPRATKLEEVKEKLTSYRVSADTLSYPSSLNPHSQRIYMTLSLPIDEANKLASALDAEPGLGWFISILPPKAPKAPRANQHVLHDAMPTQIHPLQHPSPLVQASGPIPTPQGRPAINPVPPPIRGPLHQGPHPIKGPLHHGPHPIRGPLHHGPQPPSFAQVHPTHRNPPTPYPTWPKPQCKFSACHASTDALKIGSWNVRGWGLDPAQQLRAETGAGSYIDYSYTTADINRMGLRDKGLSLIHI